MYLVFDYHQHHQQQQRHQTSANDIVYQFGLFVYLRMAQIGQIEKKITI